MRPRATIDFESRSAADIRNGPWAYSRHSTTRILCLSFVLPGWDKDDPSLWSPIPELCYYGKDGSQTLEVLYDYIRAGGIVEAHNVQFERAMWFHVAQKPVGVEYDPESGQPWVATGMGAPPLKDTQLRCSAAKCAAFALPRALGQAGEALGLTVLKDDEGSRVMKLIVKPRNPLKAEPKVDEVGERIIYWRPFNLDEFTQLYAYCQQDVRAEHAISEAVPDLSEAEYQVWLADMRANWRGVRVDIDLVHAAIKMDQQVKADMNEELTALTIGYDPDEPDKGIAKGTERRSVMAWLAAHDLVLADTTAPTLDWVMEQKEFKQRPPDVQRVVEIARNINRTSVTKYVRVLACMDPDDNRVRDLVMYHGAATGRWSGKGIQVQNFPRGTISDITGMSPYDAKYNPNGWTIQSVVEDIKSGDLAWCRMVYGDVLALLSSALRGVLIPSPGMVFYVADYSAIEARVVLWLADAQVALEVFRAGGDIYCDIATDIYGRPITKKDKAERQFGKVTILGLGYGMGFLTFLLTLRSYKLHFTEAEVDSILGDKKAEFTDWVKERLWPTPPTQDQLSKMSNEEAIKTVKSYKAAARQAASDRRRLTEARENPEAIIHELALCKFTVDKYRARYPEVPELWKAQEKAATDAVKLWTIESRLADEEDFRDMVVQPVVCGKVTWYVEGDHLFCRLPGGRCLVYNHPSLKYEPTPWGKKRASLRFMGVHKKTKKWSDMGTYGGSIVENIDQATARDMMAYALNRVSEAFESGELQYEPITTIHDELLAEAPEWYGDVSQFEHLLTDLPAEYAGCPVAAEGARLTRYQK